MKKKGRKCKCWIFVKKIARKDDENNLNKR